MKRIKPILFSVFIVLLSGTSPVFAQFSEAGVERFRVAVETPDFTLKELEGGKISLKELKGKVILLNFFAPY